MHISSDPIVASRTEILYDQTPHLKLQATSKLQEHY